MTLTGSMEPGVYQEEVSNTLRMGWLTTVAVHPHDPNVAYLASYHGHVWKTLDGGKTWDESRLIVEPRPFFGDKSQYLYFGWQRINSPHQSAFDRGVAGKPRRGGYGGGDSLAASGAGGGGGGRRGQAQNLLYGIGLPGGAPRLQLFVRRWGKPTAGLNIKQTLLLQGTRGLEVSVLVIHPEDPKVIFACTAFGLYKTRDGGLNWVRVFTGTRFYNNVAVGRLVRHMAVDPLDGDRLFVATGEGVFISYDRGETFTKSTKQGLGDTHTNWIYFNPYDPRYVFAGTDYGLMRSKDRGENWEWVYFTTFPTGRIVREVQIDPFDKRTGYLATHDGLFVTPDLLSGGMDLWKRLGGLTFTGVEVPRIVPCRKHKGHLWSLGRIKLPSVVYPGMHDSGGSFIWESVDGGNIWKPLDVGRTSESAQWITSHPTEPDLLWMVWSRSAVRLKRRRAGEESFSQREVKIPDDIPPVGEVILAGVRYAGVDAHVQMAYRRRSMLKALMPRLDASYARYHWKDLKLRDDGLYPSLPFRYNDDWGATLDEFRVMLTWDLAPLVFNLEASMFGRVDRVNASIRGWLGHALPRFAGELRRLHTLMANDPPKDLRVRTHYKLRIEELESYLDFITGGYLTYWRRGGRARGIETRWWDPWVKSRAWWRSAEAAAGP